jgi:sarcosine oxidase subunit beta
VNELHAESAAIYRELEAEGPIPFDLREEMLLVLAAEPDELEHARAYAEATGGKEHDTRADPWLADDLAGGFLVGGGLVLDPLAVTAAMAEAARRAGADLRTGSGALRVVVRDDRVRAVATDDGVIETERAVVATGPSTRTVLRTAGVDLPVAATRGWLLETPPVERRPPYAIEQAVWPSQEVMGTLARDRTLGELADTREDEPGIVSLLLGVHGAGQLRIGTSLSRSLTADAEASDTPRRLAERAVRVAPHLRDVPVTAVWTGRRAVTPDGLPVVGAVPGVEGLEVASGFSSIGMVTIPAACKRFVEGRADAFDPARFAV